MWGLFNAELQRFRGWAGAYAALHVVVLGFLNRIVDMAQQPSEVYWVIGGIYTLTGLLLGLYQIGGYRRPNAWLNLLHRPLPHWQIAAALFGAGAVVLLAAILLPLLVIAGWQETMTARVIDARHLLLCLSGLVVALCGYLAGSYCLLGNKRYGVCALIFLLLLFASNASGIGAIALQVSVLVWLATLIAFAFKPDLSTLPRRVPGIISTAVPLQMTLWFALLVLGTGAEMLWIVQGSHPLNSAAPPPGGSTEAERAEGKELMLAGLASSADPEAPLWREQVAIAEVFLTGTTPAMLAMPERNELTNVIPMEFDDPTRRVRWVFSHDSMRFEGYSLADKRAVGSLGVLGDATFSSPPLPGPDGILLGRDRVYQYDSETQLVLPRAQLPNGEVVTGFDRIGERLALLSNRALYFYDGRELELGDGLLTPRQRVPLPGRIGNLSRIDLIELLDGYLISFTFSRGANNGDGPALQLLQRVDDQSRVTAVARRVIAMDYAVGWRYQNWYPSPLLYAVQKAAINLFATYTPILDIERPPVPRGAILTAGLLLLASMLGAILYAPRTALSTPTRWIWIVVCAAVGLPALLSLWLMYPARERLDVLPLAQPAPA